MANNKVNKNRHELTFTVDGEIWTKQVNKAFEKIKKNVKIDGFRPGKVTKEIFDKKFGKEDYLTEAANVVIEEEFLKVAPMQILAGTKSFNCAPNSVKVNKSELYINLLGSRKSSIDTKFR